MITRITFFFLMILMYQISYAQSVGVGTNTPNSSAILDVQSTTKGMLLPRMTTSQRIAISSPASGLMVYDTDSKTNWQYDGTQWNNSQGGGGGFSLPYNATVNLATPAFKITNSNNGASIMGSTTGQYGVGMSGQATSTYGWGVNAYSRSPLGTALYASGDSSVAVNATSTHGIGITAYSQHKSAVRSYTNNPMPTLDISNAHILGVAIQATANAGTAIKGTSYGFGVARYGVWGEAKGTGNTGLCGTAESETGFGIYGANTTGVAIQGTSISGIGIKAHSNSGYAIDANGKVKIYGGNTNPSNGAVLTSDAQGNAVWKNNNIAFRGTGYTEQYSGISDNYETYLMVLEEDYDIGNVLTTYQPTQNSSGNTIFNVSANGVYHIDVNYSMWTWELPAPIIDVGQITVRLLRNGEETIIGNAYVFNAEWSLTLQLSLDHKLQVGDKVYVTLYQDNDEDYVLHPLANSYFSAHLVFPY